MKNYEIGTRGGCAALAGRHVLESFLQRVKSDVMETPREIVRFGAFELNLVTGKLCKRGVRLKLSGQPLRVLLALVEKPGSLVTREVLKQQVWPTDTFVDFERGLNRAVSQLRAILGDHPRAPRYIETLSGRGYCFVAAVEDGAEAPIPATAPSPGAASPFWRRFSTRFVLVAFMGAAVLGAAALSVFKSSAPLTLRWRKLTVDNYRKYSPAVSDGTRIYFRAGDTEEEFLAQAPVSGGDVTRLALKMPTPYFYLLDLSPDGQELLVKSGEPLSVDLYGMMVGELFSVRVADGSTKKISPMGITSAEYSADGRLALSTQSEIWVGARDGRGLHRLLSLRDSLITDISWVPDGKGIWFSRRSPGSSVRSVWEIQADGARLRRLSPAWGETDAVPAGWTADNRIGFVVSSNRLWRVDQGLRLFGSASPQPINSASKEGPDFLWPARARRTQVAYTLGAERLGELQKYDSRLRRWTTLLNGISAEVAQYSPDGQRIAYLEYPSGNACARNADGSGFLQLSDGSMGPNRPVWSPDGARIAFSARRPPDLKEKCYVVSAAGGPPSLAVPSESGQQADCSWSPDGKQIAYGLPSNDSGEDVYIRIYDVRTGRILKLAGSEGLFAPRWSPDGSMLAALPWRRPRWRPGLMLYNVKTQRWGTVLNAHVDWPAWTPDSKAILYRDGRKVMKLLIDGLKTEVLSESDREDFGGFSHWMGVAADGSAMRTLDHDSLQVYRLELGR